MLGGQGKEGGSGSGGEGLHDESRYGERVCLLVVLVCERKVRDSGLIETMV